MWVNVSFEAMRRLSLAATVLLTCLVGSPAASQSFRFEDSSEAAGFEPFQRFVAGHGSGVAAIDLEDDGLIDLFVTTPRGSGHQLYRNLGGGQFEEEECALVGE